MDQERKYAEVLQLICNKYQNSPGKKMVQKLIYLMERKGVDLRSSYRIHFYGPYSDKLDNALHSLETQNIISIDTNKQTHFIRMKGKPLEIKELTVEERQTVQYVLDTFHDKTASELEAVTTLDYAARNLVPPGSPEDVIIFEVERIKGEKFTEEALRTDLKILIQEKYLAPAAGGRFR